MAHVVAAHHSGSVRQAFRGLLVRGAEEERRRIDRAAGDHHDSALVLLSSAVALDDDLRHLAPGGTGQKPLHVRAGEEPDVRVLERGVHRENLGVGLRAHQARISVAGVAADAAARLGPRFVEQDAQRRVERPQAAPGEVLVQVLQPRLVAHRWVREGFAGWRLGRVLSPLAMHVVHALGARVVRLELAVRDRPCGRNTAVVAQLAKVFLAQPEERRSVELGIPAHGVVRVRVEIVSGAVLPDLLGLVLARKVHRASPSCLLARDESAALQKEDPLPGGRQPVHQRPAACARPDDDHVVGIVRRHGCLQTKAPPPEYGEGAFRYARGKA